MIQTPIIISKNRVSELRARYHITQEELAKYLHLKPSNYRKKEKEFSLWKENEMHLIIYLFNTQYGENLSMEDVFSAEVIEM